VFIAPPKLHERDGTAVAISEAGASSPAALPATPPDGGSTHGPKGKISIMQDFGPIRFVLHRHVRKKTVYPVSPVQL